MSRTYQTTIPTRAEMINVVRSLRGPEKEVIPLCEELGDWLRAVESARRGLSDWCHRRKHTVRIRGHSRWRVTILARESVNNLALVALLKKWAEQKQATPAQIALAWLMAQKPWIVPIPGTTQMPHMIENTGAAAVRFAPAELAELNSSVRAIEVRGQRLPDAVLVFSAVEAPPKKSGAP